MIIACLADSGSAGFITTGILTRRKPQIGNIHDIDHLIRVWTYAKTIGDLEGLDQQTQYILEIAAITHDIACPLCREKYGNTNGKYQESEGALMVRNFLSEADYIANATENGYSKENAANFMEKIMKTKSGKRIMADVFGF